MNTEAALEFANTNLGVLLKASLFPASSAATGQLGDSVLFTLLLYGGLQLIVAPVLIKLYRPLAGIAPQ